MRLAKSLLPFALACGLTLANGGVVADGARIAVLDGSKLSPSGLSIIAAIEAAWLKPWKQQADDKLAAQVVSNASALTPETTHLLADAEVIHRACDDGVLLPTTLRTRMRSRSLMSNGVTGCGVPVLAMTTRLLFRRDAAGDTVPERIDALFDVEAFPGKRALVVQPDTIIEWALMSYGVPRQDLYELLSTERGLKLAFRRLDRIRAHTIWCASPECAVSALKSAEASIAIVGDSAAVALLENPVLETLPGSTVVDHLELALVADRSSATALPFADFAESENGIQALAQATGLAAPNSDSESLIRDSAWYARTRSRLEQRFAKWLNGIPVRP